MLAAGYPGLQLAGAEVHNVSWSPTNSSSASVVSLRSHNASVSHGILGPTGGTWPAADLASGWCVDANNKGPAIFYCIDVNPDVPTGSSVDDCQNIAMNGGKTTRGEKIAPLNEFAMGFMWGKEACTYDGDHVSCCGWYVDPEYKGDIPGPFTNCGYSKQEGGGLIAKTITNGNPVECYSALKPPKPPKPKPPKPKPPKPKPPKPMPICEKGWPSFAKAADLAASPWGAYLTDLYGASPPNDRFPLDLSSWWTLYGSLIDKHHVTLPKSAGKCAPPDCQLNLFKENNMYSPASSQWIWHPPPYVEFPADTWIEVTTWRANPSMNLFTHFTRPCIPFCR